MTQYWTDRQTTCPEGASEAPLVINLAAYHQMFVRGPIMLSSPKTLPNNK
jgi:hypothetical protein